MAFGNFTGETYNHTNYRQDLRGSDKSDLESNIYCVTETPTLIKDDCIILIIFADELSNKNNKILIVFIVIIILQKYNGILIHT